MQKVATSKNKMVVMMIVITILCSALSACGCEHEYNEGTIITESTCVEHGVKKYTCSLCGKEKQEKLPKVEHDYETEVMKEATFEEEGELIYTCTVCRDSYKETIPIKENKVEVKVTGKNNIPKNTRQWRFSDRVEFTFEVTNLTEKDIKGVQGILSIEDLFGVEIKSFQCDFTGTSISANATVTIGDMGMDINEFIDEDVKIYSTDYEDLNFSYQVTCIVYEDGTREDVDK